MERLALEISVREGRGKGPARRLRARGRTPGILYGYGVAPLAIDVASRPLERALEVGSNALIDLSGADGLKGRVFLIKDAQRDPLSREVVHCDFYSVDTDRRINVDVPVRLEGKPVGVEQQGGVLEPLLRTVEVSCMPLAIPEEILVDVSGLEIGQAVHVSDLTVPAGVEIQVEGSISVVHVIAPRVEEAAAPEGEEAAAVAEGEEAPDAEAPAAEGEAG
jgi:large subunit ribosomal protein L25